MEADLLARRVAVIHDDKDGRSELADEAYADHCQDQVVLVHLGFDPETCLPIRSTSSKGLYVIKRTLTASVTRWLDCVYFWPFTKSKICPIACKNRQNGFKRLLNTK